MPFYTWFFHKLMKNPNFWAKSGPNLDQFAPKRSDPDKSPELWTKVEALQLYNGRNEGQTIQYVPKLSVFPTNHYRILRVHLYLRINGGILLILQTISLT